ncbi:MAG TPA: serine hydrolase domain-containing protein [Rhodanobacter sp.]|jgi:CubicO group peptidase (beta-lactamase class C family)|nr:serine hydrolase domain-containing protein [Rhodanobacter sp.]
MRRPIRILGALFVAILPMAALAAEPARAGADRLLGLWGNETVFAPQIAGTLVIDDRGGEWRASIDGFDAAVRRDGDRIDVTLPGDQGRFRGHLVADASAIDGFWIQSAGITLSNAYATPLTLKPVQAGVWSGQVHPLPDRVSQYLKIWRESDGSMVASIANPEFNLGRSQLYKVKVDGDALTLNDPRRPAWQLHGNFDEDSDQLRIDWQGIGLFAFARRDREHAVGFYPRTPEATEYIYRQPLGLGDGWATSSLQDAGFDARTIAALVEQIERDAMTGPAAPQVQGLLIARHGKLVVEEYFHGFDSERTHDTRSAGKTFASLMVGLAMQHNAVLTPDTPMVSLFPQYKDLANPDPRKRRITVANLMSMTSGLACDDNDEKSPGNEDVMQSQHRQNDWYRYTLDLPMVRDPGGDKAVYCSAGINLLGGVISHTTGTWLPAFFDAYVGRPLQMRDYHINLMPDGDAYLAGGIYLRPRDMLKLGQLYLAGGVWNGHRVIDRHWVDLSTTRHAELAPGHGYGYAWHLHEMKAADHDYREYAAEGNGGQFMIVLPELDITVVITAGNYSDFKTWYPLQDLVAKYIIPAAAKH